MSLVDLIVPTIPGREASLGRLLRSLEGSGATPVVVEDSETCGAGWIEGLRRSDAPYVGLFADDLELVGDRFPACAVEEADLGGLPCPRVYRPDGTIESQGGDMLVPGHVCARPRAHRTAVDFTTVPFMTRGQAETVGMIPTQYCCDVWVSYRGRLSGYETRLCHGYDLVHHQEAVGRGAGTTQGERDPRDTEEMLQQLAYASHLPALRTVLERVTPRRVLEIGAGRASTREFLSWPIDELDSVEEDPGWRETIRAELPDERLRLLEEIPDPADYDLVFVDGPDTYRGRLDAISTVLSGSHPTVIVHDAEVPEYRGAIAEHNGVAEFFTEEVETVLSGDTILRPREPKQTAVVW